MIPELFEDKARQGYEAHRFKAGIVALALALACAFQAGRACSAPEGDEAHDRARQQQHDHERPE